MISSEDEAFNSVSWMVEFSFSVEILFLVV